MSEINANKNRITSGVWSLTSKALHHHSKGKKGKGTPRCFVGIGQ